MTSPNLMSGSPEASQLRQVLEGNHELFSALVKPFRHSLYRKAVSITGCMADAEEAVQAAIMNAFSQLHNFRHEARLQTWLMSITINEARLLVRRRLRRKEDPLALEDSNDSAHSSFIETREDPHQALARKQLRHAILSALIYLPPRYNQPFILRYMQLFTIADAAKTLGISESCFKSRLRRSRMKMRKALSHWRVSR